MSPSELPVPIISLNMCHHQNPFCLFIQLKVLLLTPTSSFNIGLIFLHLKYLTMSKKKEMRKLYKELNDLRGN